MSMNTVPSRNELDRSRKVHLMGLFMWTLRRLLATDKTDDVVDLLDIGRELADEFDDLEDVAATFDVVNEQIQSGDDPWSRWSLTERPSGIWYERSTDEEFARAFVVLALDKVDSSGETELAPRSWIAERYDAFTRALASLTKHELGLVQVRPQPPHSRQSMESAETPPIDDEDPRTAIDDMEAKRSALLRLIEASALRERRLAARALRETPLDPTGVEQFLSHIRMGWSSNRVGRELFAKGGAVIEETTPLKGDELWPLVDRWLPRSMFFERTPWADLESFAHEMGRVTADEEMRALVRALRAAQDLGTQQVWSEAVVSSGFVAMRERGHEPTLILMPVNWRLEREILGERGNQVRNEVGEVDYYSAAAMRWVRGRFGQVPVVAWPEVPRDRIYLVDIANFAHFREWTNDGGPLQVRITDYSQEEALRLAHDVPDLFRSEGSTESRAEKIRENVLLRVWSRFRVDVLDGSAALALSLVDASE